MKLNRLINNANIIISNQNMRENSLLRNNSSLSLSNNDNSKNNVSLTTNVNTPRKNSISSNLISIKYSKGLPKCGSLSILTPTNTRINKHQIEILDKADTIIKERFKFKDFGYEINKKFGKKVAIKEKKDISLKNYIINLLKKKRTEINENQRIMSDALKDFSNQFNVDYKKFNEYVEELIKKQRQMDDIVNKLKTEREKTEKILKEYMFEYKKLEDNIERKLKLIYITNKYAIFFNEVFNLPYNFKNLPLLNRNYNFEKVADIIIKIYETKDKEVPLPKILNDENIITQKYSELENIILYNLHNRSIVIEEIKKDKEYYKSELGILENTYKANEIDLKNIKEELNVTKKLYKYIRQHEEKENDEYINFIIELGKEIIGKGPLKTGQNNSNGYLSYCRKVLATLEKNEVTINNYINRIELILKYGEKEDKKLVQKCILETKKINKRENQYKLKSKQEELEKEKNLRYIKRAQKIIVKGRNTSPIFPPIKNAHKIKKINVNDDNENDIDYVYSVTDEED